MGEDYLSRRTALRATSAIVATSLGAGCLGLGGSSGQQTVEATFDDGKEGWSVVDMQTYGQTSDPDWGEVIQTLEFAHEPSGGVEDSGYISHVDDTGGKAFFFSAADEFLGDRSAFAGGRLEFSLKTDPNDWQRDSVVVLQGSETVLATGFEQPGAEWTSYSIPLDADRRTYRESNLDGAEVDQSTLEGVLSALQALRINGEYSNETQETVGLDEVRLVTG